MSHRPIRLRFTRLGQMAGLTAALLVSCGRGPTEPIRDLPLMIELSSTPRTPEAGVLVTAKVTNRGFAPIYFNEGCSAGPGVRFEILAPDRQNVADVCRDCPNIICVICAGADARLRVEPGHSITRQASFDGTLYNCDGPYQGASGEYTVTAEFTGDLREDRSESLTVRRTTTFGWSAP